MKMSPLLLTIDTSTKCSSLSLTRGTLTEGEVVASLALSSSVTHSRRLIGCIEYLLSETGIDWPQIDGVGVGLGPGSFTGLRIGLATAKGIAAAAEKPLLGVSTLDGLAAACISDRKICVVVDARKKQVYTAYYTHGKGGHLQRLEQIRVCNPEFLVGEIEEPTLFLGDGVAAYGNMWRQSLGDNILVAPAHMHTVSAQALGLYLGQKFLHGDFLDIDSAEPLYVRASDAELSLAQQKKNSGT